MNKLLIIFLLSAASLSASKYCKYTTTKDPKTGVTRDHSIRQGNCNCHCTARRFDNGTCSECGHVVTKVILKFKDAE
jgi:hypothetical protein